MLSESYCEYYMNNESFECAQMAAGSAIELTKAILDNKVQNGLALIRPPGHHAMKGECNGFCIFNNVAIAGKFKRMLVFFLFDRSPLFYFISFLFSTFFREIVIIASTKHKVLKCQSFTLRTIFLGLQKFFP